MKGFPAIPGPIPGANFAGDMSFRRRDLFAVWLAVVTFLLGCIAWNAPRPTPIGLHLAMVNDQVVVGSVEVGSPAALNGLQPGMIVIWLDNFDLLADSPATKAELAGSARVWSNVGTIWPDQLLAELAARRQVTIEQAAATPTPPFLGPEQFEPGWDVAFPPHFGASFWFPDLVRPRSGLALVLGLAIFLAGVAWLRSGRAGASLRQMGYTLPAATAVPLFVLPMELLPTLSFLAASIVILPTAMVPLAADFADRRSGSSARRLRIAVAMLAVASAASGLAFLAGGYFYGLAAISAALAACVVLLPGLLAARPTLSKDASNASGSAPAPGRFVESTELALAAATPVVALAFTLAAVVWEDQYPNPLPVALWIAAILLARRFSLRPLLRLATRATLQRDIVVAATEAERARIAADIHDDALQDLTMLVRRLDSAGDTENAEAAREIAGRLRAICGELRLPILDDLGLGPALDWLTERFEPIARGPVYLERNRDEQRPPANVELALFRIAQEALNNAVKHGAPPIVVRYRAGGTWAELDVDDAGRGLAPGAAELAEQTGHLGLLTMTQRSEAVGAELRIGRRPGGGTRVSVVGEANASTAHVAEGASGAAATATALPQP